MYRGINRAEIFGQAPKYFVFGPARPKINVLQNLYNGLNFLLFLRGWRKGHKPLMKILLSTSISIICNFISVQLQTFKILKTNFQNFGIFSKFWAT